MAWIKYNKTSDLGNKLNTAVNYFYLAQAQIENLNDTVTSMTDQQISDEMGIDSAQVSDFKTTLNLLDQALEAAKQYQRDLT